MKRLTTAQIVRIFHLVNAARRKILGDALLFFDSSQSRPLQKGFVDIYYVVCPSNCETQKSGVSLRQQSSLTMGETK